MNQILMKINNKIKMTKKIKMIIRILMIRTRYNNARAQIQMLKLKKKKIKEIQMKKTRVWTTLTTNL